MSRHRRFRTLALSTVALWCVSLVACGSDAAAPETLVSIGAGVKGPRGLHATVFARGLKNVAAFATDADGRLWAATASFEDTGTDALYLVAEEGATPRKVLTGLHTALGLLWHDDELYVASKERVDAYADFDGKAFGSKRTVVTFPSGVGEVNGLTISKAGRISLGISSPCDACDPASPYSATVVSFLPDGSGLRVDASGIRAAVGLAYDTRTGDLFATMNQRDDLGAKTPGDWVGVIRSGQDWKYPDCYGQGGSVCRGVPGPVAELDEHAAVSGIALVADGLAGSGRQAVVAEYTQGKVQRVKLSGRGEATTGQASSFLTGFENPVPVLAGADGSIFVGDWKAGTIIQVTKT